MENLRAGQSRVRIEGEEARHLLKVLRMQEGDRLVLAGPDGIRMRGRIEFAAKGQVSVLIEEALPPISAPPVKIALGQGLLKSRAMDLLIQKTSELGLSELIPFLSERTVVKWDEAKGARKLRHWEGISRASLKQSDRHTPLRIERPVAFSDLLSRKWPPETVKLILWEEEKAQDLKGLLREGGAGRGVVALVGPEGGFSKKEVDEAKNKGFRPVSLGPRILRAETASMVLVAFIQYEWGDMSKRA